ncbi:MAG: hypothetical protein ACR2GP_11420 [Burkholderiaceae bacterium]
MLLAWKNEADLAKKEFGAGKVDIVIPSISVLAEGGVFDQIYQPGGK